MSMIQSFKRDFRWIAPLAFLSGAALSFLQGFNWLNGWLGFSLLFLISFSLLALALRWAEGSKALVGMLALAFALRFLGGVTTYFVLPLNGYPDDEDDRAGFVYTDAHRRDSQAWELAASEKNLLSAFNRSYAYDQYGGLLALSAFLYRALSPDAHRPLLLVLFSAFMAAVGLPFLWKAASAQWGEKTALAAGWIYALYPESVLLGGSAMREPYLMAFSAIAFWGFLRLLAREKNSLFWLALGLAGMLLISPIAALAALVTFGGWICFARVEKSLPLWGVALAALIFILGLFLLSAALNRSGDFDSTSPLHVIGGWLKFAVQWDVYQLERGSGWVQKLFDEMPQWLRLPFVMIYGVFQPVLPAALVEPTTFLWRVIGIARALGWYALLPILVFALVAAWNMPPAERKLWLWMSAAVWAWILFTSLRGGGDQWDNPRYRAILFFWQALLVGRVWAWQREARSPWLFRIVLMEVVFLLFFGQWYANRYYHLWGQLPFGAMVAVILLLWALILFGGLRRDKSRPAP